MSEETAKRIAEALEQIAEALELRQKQETAKWRRQIRKDQRSVAAWVSRKSRWGAY